jgi:hypothetical protein
MCVTNLSCYVVYCTIHITNPTVAVNARAQMMTSRMRVVMGLVLDLTQGNDVVVSQGRI